MAYVVNVLGGGHDSWAEGNVKIHYADGDTTSGTTGEQYVNPNVSWNVKPFIVDINLLSKPVEYVEFYLRGWNSDVTGSMARIEEISLRARKD